MKRTESGNQSWQDSINILLGSDRLTTVLVWLALFLTGVVVAVGVDLYQRPANETQVAHSSVAREPASPAATSPVEITPTPSPPPISSSRLSPALAPSPAPTATPYPAPVRIRIPTIGVDRSIIEVPLTYDARSKTWERDYDRLFRRGKSDLVGHIDGSASPGQPGNTLLVGHNYGYGVNGVFQRLGRLKVGQQVEVVNAAGQGFTYRVTEVISVPWTKKNQQELLRHQDYLSVEGDERLTMVTCGGRNWAPFPNRVYVVAAPAR